MKILTDSEYSALLSKSSTSEVTEANRLHKIELDRVKAEYEDDSKDKARQIKRLEEDSKIAIDRVKAEQDLVVQKATKTFEDKVQKLTIESEGYKKEKEILTQAFKNLGFDVKDMKEILNKLVDGIVSKNQIQLVK